MRAENKMDGEPTEAMISSKDSSPASAPGTTSETSRGSSVSSDLQREYEDILKYAIVTPRFDTAMPNIFRREDGDIGRREQHILSTIAEVSSTEASASRPGTAEDTREERNDEGNSDTLKYRSSIDILSPMFKGIVSIFILKNIVYIVQQCYGKF